MKMLLCGLPIGKKNLDLPTEASQGGKSNQLVRNALISDAAVKQGVMAAVTKTRRIGTPGIR